MSDSVEQRLHEYLIKLAVDPKVSRSDYEEVKRRADQLIAESKQKK